METEKTQRLGSKSSKWSTTTAAALIVAFVLVSYYSTHKVENQPEIATSSSSSTFSASSPHYSSSSFSRKKYPYVHPSRLKESTKSYAMKKHVIEGYENTVCMDGSSPVYYYASGTGDGKNKFLFHFQGGGWCYNEEECYEAAVNNAPWPPSSTKALPEMMSYPREDVDGMGYLNYQKEKNPLLYNWNIVFVIYCDGGSFASDSETLVNGERLQFRGKNIRESVIKEVFKKHALAEASDIVISGCSAGGLAVLMGIDQMAKMIHESNKRANVKALVDSGFFAEYSSGLTEFDNTEPSNVNTMKKMGMFDPINPLTHSLDYAYALKYVFKMMNMVNGINPDCLQDNREDNGGNKCMFGETVGKYVQTPMFILQSKYDSWQIQHVTGKKKDVEAINKLGSILQSSIENIVNKSYSRHGAHVDSCVHHCSTCSKSLFVWNNKETTVTSERQAFEKWFHLTSSNSSEFKDEQSHVTSNLVLLDSPYPCKECC